MEEKNLKGYQLAELAGIHAVTMSKILNNKMPQVSLGIIGKIATALNVTIERLQYQGNIEIVETPKGRIPVISWVQAGKWHEAIDAYPAGVAEEWVPYETRSKGVFALRVKGDSMEPEYRDGDTIIVNPQIEARAGDDVIARYGNDVTFKRLKKQNGTILLSPLNPAHPDIIITGKDLKNYRTIGVVEGLMRKKKRGK